MKPLTTFRHLWLCDDDADDHFVFAEALKQAAPDAVLGSFYNGDELLACLQQHKPDILFLDINMPVINGFEALEKIRSAGGNDFPIVMYSVSDQPVDIDTAYHYGALLYVVKPQLYQDLVKQLKILLAGNWHNTQEPGAIYYDGEKFGPLPMA